MLVATHFLPKIAGKEKVINIDGDFSNNNVDNLKWVTQREKMRHLHPDKNKKEIMKLEENFAEFIKKNNIENIKNIKNIIK